MSGSNLKLRASLTDKGDAESERTRFMGTL